MHAIKQSHAGNGNEWVAQNAELKPVTYDRIAPNPRGESRALSQIGYSLQQALADLIDNSVDAGARNVLVRFIHTNESVERIVIADDGSGMTEGRLKQAMQIGAEMDHRPGDLGLYGTGLKTASFSQCRTVSVVTMAGGRSSGRAWAREEIDRGWKCGVLNTADCARMLSRSWGPVRIGKHGTLIVWDRLKDAYAGKNGCVGYLRGVFQRVSLHLGLCFHRIIAKHKVRIHLDARLTGRIDPTLSTEVKPIDPFGYPATGHKHYPKTFVFDLGKLGRTKARAHIWPAKSKALEYKLGGQAAARQGFYFYRNDRLIQAGGWNRTRADAAEPHMSLARVDVELPADLHDEFRLNTQKSSVEVPDFFREAVLSSVSGSVTWSDYLKDANAAYRRKGPEIKALPIIPGKGLPARVRSRAKQAFEVDRHAVRISFRWEELDHDKIFDIERPEKRIVLNDRYRTELGRRGKDGLIKTALFLMLQREFRHERAAKKRSEWLDRCNELLIAALDS